MIIKRDVAACEPALTRVPARVDHDRLLLGQRDVEAHDQSDPVFVLDFGRINRDPVLVLDRQGER